MTDPRQLAEETQREWEKRLAPGTLEKYRPPREYRLARELLSALDALEAAARERDQILRSDDQLDG